MNIRAFKKMIGNYYAIHKRNLPWRNTTDPYCILVSEVMLQQTQVSRVLKKYPEFIKAFPDIRHLANAQLADLLSVWQGMGYNRRVLYLKATAETIMKRYKETVPDDASVLQTLPGLGAATACSIVTFAYNKPTVFIETNIRRVYIHCFFEGKNDISDKTLAKLVEKTVDRKRPRDWYYGLMDYGAYLSKQGENPNRRSKSYTRQKIFEGSDRQIRGALLRYMLAGDRIKAQVFQNLSFDRNRIEKNLECMVREGFIRQTNGRYYIK